MKLARKIFLVTAKTIVLLAGFGAGLIAGVGDSSPPTVVEGIIILPLAILIIPPLIVLSFRINVATGFFKPPWETPSRAEKMNPLSAVQLGSFICIAIGLGATVSIAWRGLVAFYYALVGFSAGIGLHLALVRLMSRYPPPQMNIQESNAETQ
jgi:hypothetical protein